MSRKYAKCTFFREKMTVIGLGYAKSRKWSKIEAWDAVAEIEFRADRHTYTNGKDKNAMYFN